MIYSHWMRFQPTWVLLLAGLAPMFAVAQAPSSFAIGQAPVSQLPDGPNRETVQRVCSGCHSVQMFVGRGMTR